MKTRTIIFIVIGVLILIGLAYYFLIYKKEQGKREGTEVTGGDTSTPTPIPTPTPVPNMTSLKVGDNVYLNSDKSQWKGTGSGIPVYRNSIADSQGSFLAGTTRADWMPGWNIGKVVEVKPGWTKVSLNSFQIWKFIVNTGYTNQIEKITGDYWFSDKGVLKL